VLKQPGTYELSMLSNSFAEMSQTLHERSQYIQQFASHVSHEFKTPLTSMQGSLELLQEHIDDMPIKQRQRFLGNLQEDTERLKNLVNRLLEQARADALLTTSDSCNLLKVVEILQSRYIDAPLHVIFDKAVLDISVTISSSALESILSNLFDNSLQHKATQVTLSATNQQSHIQISILDNGSGISKANQNKIFTPFFTTRRESGGTGLGLGIIESLLKASNGTIVNINVENGALFVLSLGLE
jgi:signal transduction histidine kinase